MAREQGHCQGVPAHRATQDQAAGLVALPSRQHQCASIAHLDCRPQSLVPSLLHPVHVTNVIVRTCVNHAQLLNINVFTQRKIFAGEKEFRELSREEEKCLRAADSTPGGAAVADWPLELLHGLFRRHLIYIDIPVAGSQRFSTSSLEGFVSNRDLVAGDSDPMEALLYEVRRALPRSAVLQSW